MTAVQDLAGLIETNLYDLVTNSPFALKWSSANTDISTLIA